MNNPFSKIIEYIDFIEVYIITNDVGAIYVDENGNKTHQHRLYSLAVEINKDNFLFVDLLKSFNIDNNINVKVVNYYLKKLIIVEEKIRVELFKLEKFLPAKQSPNITTIDKLIMDEQESETCAPETLNLFEFIKKAMLNYEQNLRHFLDNTAKLIYEIKNIYEHLNIENSPESNIISSKLKWNASPSLLGYIFGELVKKGYLEAPLHNGETNFTGLAKQVWEYFEINTTKENLIREMNENKNSLSETKRAKFTIPELTDLK